VSLRERSCPLYFARGKMDRVMRLLDGAMCMVLLMASFGIGMISRLRISSYL
jgi:hypothetical protein